MNKIINQLFLFVSSGLKGKKENDAEKKRLLWSNEKMKNMHGEVVFVDRSCCGGSNKKRHWKSSSFESPYLSVYFCQWELEETTRRSGCGSRASRGTTRTQPATAPNPHKLKLARAAKNWPRYVVTNSNLQQILMGWAQRQAPELSSLVITDWIRSYN